MQTLGISLAAASGYLLGSIPAGFIAGRVAGIDIRTCGSGNIGATNVLRVLGKKYGYPVFLFDFFKGLAAVFLSQSICRESNAAIPVELCAITGGVAAVVGHSYPVWLGFKGGKGVATSLGVLVALIPVAAIIMVAVWAVIFFLTGYVSVASLAAAVILPVATALLIHGGTITRNPLFHFTIAIAVLIVWRHRRNIGRLWQGNEARFQRK